jgi:hypothetical protein
MLESESSTGSFKEALVDTSTLFLVNSFNSLTFDPNITIGSIFSILFDNSNNIILNITYTISSLFCS